jgi:putative ABC transport system permease protein
MVGLRPINTMPSFLQDLRYAARMLRANPGFTLVAILTLALGIGANTAIFSFVNGVLLKPLPYAHPERILMVWEKPPGGDRNGISTLNYLDWKSQNTVFDGMAAQRGSSMTMSGVAEPVELRAALVSAPYFEIFGVRAALGRTFAKDEDERGAPRVAVMSYKLWQNRFGGDKDILGRKLILDGQPYTVIGVLPRNSSYDRTYSEIWLPLVFEPKDMTRNFHWFRSYARLKEGVTLDQARAEMKVIGARIEKQYPDSNKGWSVTVDALADRIVGSQLRQSLYVLLAAVGAVLLIGCANLANLTLARGTSREREVAIRASLGAGRWRLLRQFLTENVLLSLLGGCAGLALGWVMVKGLKFLMPPFMLPSEADVSVDIRVLLFTLGIAVLTGVVFGLAPALQASHPNLASTMKEGGRGSTASVARRRLRGGLVVLETALAFVLLTGAGLLIRSFDQLQQVNAGFDTTNVLTMNIPFPAAKFKEGNQAARYVRQITDAIETIPGIREVAATSVLPLRGWSNGMPFQIAGKPVKDHANREACFFKQVSPSYFHSLGIRLRKGRGLTEKDVSGAPPVAVINETMAKKYFPGEDPIGQRILVQEILYGRPGLGPEVPWQVVGMIADEKISGLDDDRSAGMYVPISQSPMEYVSLVVKGEVNPETMQQAIQLHVHQVDPDQALTDVKTLETIKSESVGPNRLRTTLLGVFAGIALLLAAIGIYGVISYSVAQRTHEMGVRSALGASRLDILRLVIANGMLLASSGLVIGLAGAFGLTRLLKSLLFGVSATDPVTMTAVAAVLAGVALSACYVPARRATKVDPAVALRYE